MMRLVLCLVAALPIIADATSTAHISRYALKDRHPVPSQWQAVKRANGSDRIRLEIGLKHGRFEELELHLHEGKSGVIRLNKQKSNKSLVTVSDPTHSRYGKHLTGSEIAELTKPSNETQQLVKAWLDSHGLQPLEQAASDWVTLHVEIRKAEELLATKYYVYRNIEDGTVSIRTPEWSLPEHLHSHIDAVHPTNAFLLRSSTTAASRQPSHPHSRAQPSPRKKKAFSSAPLGLGQNGIPTYDELAKIDITEMGHMDVPSIADLPTKSPSPSQACNRLATSPLCLRTLYGTLNYVPSSSAAGAGGNVSVALVNYLGQVNNRSDVEIFLSRYRPEAVSGAHEFTTEIVAGGSDQQTPVTQAQLEKSRTVIGLEGNLNAETILGIAWPVPLTAYNVGGEETRPPFQATEFTPENKNEPYLEWLRYVLAKPDGEIPQVITTSYADEEQSVPYWYAKRVCDGFAALGARGVTVLFASGDEGVGKDGKCFSNAVGEGKRRKKMFLPTFPASCPYVTVVGGTRGWEPEMVGFDARSGFASGGGFSNYFPRPAYQKEAVDRYVEEELGDMYAGLYNRTGRGYPDISARAYHYITVWNGTAHILDGTSASSPAMAGIVALVNDALATLGRPPLGWLNPWIYRTGWKGFRDVTVGSNVGCDTPGFPARKGWDAATGFGTPVSFVTICLLFILITN